MKLFGIKKRVALEIVSVFSTGDDPEMIPEMIPDPEMIPKSTPK